MPKDKRPAPALDENLRRKCTEMVYYAAKKFDVPAVYIAAHTRHVVADEARKWVMREMISELGMRRWQVALAFGRDLRRVRRSVLGV